jgi:hypothetical protein
MKLRTATLLITIGASVVVSCSSSQSRVIDGESHLMSSNVDIQELEYRPVAQGRRFQMFTFAVANRGGRTQDELWLLSRIFLDRATHCVRKGSNDRALVVRDALEQQGKAFFCGGPINVSLNVEPSGSASVEFTSSPSDACLLDRCLQAGLDGLSLPGPATARVDITTLYVETKMEPVILQCSELR